MRGLCWELLNQEAQEYCGDIFGIQGPIQVSAGLLLVMLIVSAMITIKGILGLDKTVLIIQESGTLHSTFWCSRFFSDYGWQRSGC